jgi:hypothetical protein
MDPVSLPDHPHGPYDRPPAEVFIGYPRRRQLLHTAFAGVQLGAWDARILGWLVHVCDSPTFLAILGLLQRTRSAGAKLAHPQADNQPERESGAER